MNYLTPLIKAAGATVVTHDEISSCDASNLFIVTHDSKVSTPITSPSVLKVIEMGAKQLRLSKLFDMFMPEVIIVGVNKVEATNWSKHESAQQSIKVQSEPAQQFVKGESDSTKLPRVQARRSRIEQSHRKSTSKQKIKNYLAPTDPLPKTFDPSVRQKAVETGLKFGFNLDFGRQSRREEGDHTIVKIFTTKLTKSPTRSISNPNVGPLGHEFLGGDGTFEIYKPSKTSQTVVCYFDSTGTKKFEAEVPREYEKQIFGNAGHNNGFVWDVYDKAFMSGGTTVKGLDSTNPVGLRRVSFWFQSRNQLVIALYSIFGHDLALVEEFFDVDGRFYEAN